MEFSADTKSLAEALDQVQEAGEKKSTIPGDSWVKILKGSKPTQPSQASEEENPFRQDESSEDIPF